MDSKKRLLKGLAKKYHDRVESFHSEGGLMDDCKYILLLDEDYVYDGEFTAFPCRTLTEARMVVKESEKRVK